ncbi:MAG: hypothetical protein BGN88_04955 [Clostridiales bacterium 43-6]|mgnify:CR=1 FL=1|nr:MAG: hypothetical protein BGN88_04955 [Clostridiales bacterium 43-6]
MVFLLCAIGCCFCFLCGVWTGKGTPAPKLGRLKREHANAEEEEKKKEEEKLKEQWESLFSYNGSMKL